MKIAKALSYTALFAFGFCNAAVHQEVPVSPARTEHQPREISVHSDMTESKVDEFLGPKTEAREHTSNPWVMQTTVPSLIASISPTTAGRAGLGKRQRELVESRRSTTLTPRERTRRPGVEPQEESSTPHRSRIVYYREDLTPVSQGRFDRIVRHDQRLRNAEYIPDDYIREVIDTSDPDSDDESGLSMSELERYVACLSFSLEVSPSKSRTIVPGQR